MLESIPHFIHETALAAPIAAPLFEHLYKYIILALV